VGIIKGFGIYLSSNKGEFLVERKARKNERKIIQLAKPGREVERPLFQGNKGQWVKEGDWRHRTVAANHLRGTRAINKALQPTWGHPCCISHAGKGSDATR